MKFQPKLKKTLIVFFLLAGTIVTLGLNHFSQSASANTIFSDFTTKKLDRINQADKQALERAKQENIAHPNKNPARIPMTSDPKEKVQRIPNDIGWGIGWLTNGAYNTTELWLVGDKPNYEQSSWNPAYAYSGSLKDNPQQGFIGTFVMNGASDKSWSGNWNSPKLWGSIKITDVTGNIASFDSDSAMSGTFNLVTHEWKTN